MGFYESERIGRDKVINRFGANYNLVESEDSYACWDLSGQTSSNSFFIEIKDRRVKSTDYTTCYLEAKKYNLLSGVADSIKADKYYVCTYTDDILYVFNLNKIDFGKVNTTQMYSPIITETDYKTYKNKLVIELPFSEGTRYKINR